MPSTGAKQAKFMRAVANNPKFAKKAGVPQSVGKDYEMVDRKSKKFSEGGRAERMRERRMADIESDYKKALARGKSEKEARAKREQRLADARDDYAKRTGADRTETRAAEKAAEARLSAARRSPDKNMQAVSVANTSTTSPKVDTTALATAPKVVAETSKPKPVAKPAPKPTAKSASEPTPKAAPKYTASFPKPQPKGGTPAPKPQSKSIVQMLTERPKVSSAKRQQGQLDEMGRDARNLFSSIFRSPVSNRGAAAAKKTGAERKYAKGGSVDGIAVRGKTKLKRKK